MRVIVVGCGRIGANLAELLARENHQVTVIDQDGAAFDRLSADFSGRTIAGDVLARSVLHRAEIETADALAAVTTSDSLNALIAHVARSEYGVSRVVARNYDPRQRRMVEAFQIPVVGSASWGVQQIAELISNGPLHAVLADGKEEFGVFRLEVPQAWDRRSIETLLPPAGFTVIAWKRGGKTLASDGELLATGDLIYLSAAPAEITALRRRLGVPQEDPG
jgi:trk system potassium uptake protein TrkA